MEEYIKILELPDSFDLNDLKIAYRKMSKKYHPDFAQNPQERAYFNKKMKEINKANEVLKEYFKTHDRYTRTNHNSSQQDNHNQKNHFENNDSNIFKFTEEQKNNFEKNFYRCAIAILFLALVFSHQSPKSDQTTVQAPTTPKVVYKAQETTKAPTETPIAKIAQVPVEIIREEKLPETELPIQKQVYTPIKTKSSTTKVAKEEIPWQDSPKEAYKLYSSPNPVYVVDMPQPNSNSDDRLEWTEDKKRELLKNTDLGPILPYSVTESQNAIRYANSFVTPRFYKNWAEIANNNDLTDDLTAEIYIDLYGNLKYINLINPPRTQKLADDVRKIVNNLNPYAGLYYSKLGGDVKLTYRISSQDGQLDLKILKAQNIIW